MKPTCFRKRFLIAACFLLSLLCSSVCGSQGKPFAAGSQLPQFTFPAPDSQQTLNYLGLKAKGPATLSKIDAKIVFIEFVSAMCPKCHENAPVVNRLYKVIQEDPALSRDVKIMAICVGDDQTKVNAFKNKYKVPFPIIPDEDLAIAAALEVMETPTMVLVTNGGKVLTSHSGVIRDFDGFLKELRDIHKKL